MSTLKELADQFGFPFDAKHAKGDTFHCIGIAPNCQRALGWRFDEVATITMANDPVWQIIKPVKKVTRWKLIYDFDNGNETRELWFSSKEKAERWVESGSRSTKLSLTPHEFEVEG